MSVELQWDVVKHLRSLKRQRRTWIWAATCFFVLVAATSYVVLLGQGPAALSPGRVLEILNGGGSRSEIRVVWDLRMPVALATLIVGAALGLAGSWTQSMSRNPLASPDILGVTGGASVMVVLGTVFSRPLLADGLSLFWWRAGLALLGAVLAAILLVALGGNRHEQPHRHRRNRALPAIPSAGGVSLARSRAPPRGAIPAVAGGNHGLRADGGYCSAARGIGAFRGAWPVVCSGATTPCTR